MGRGWEWFGAQAMREPRPKDRRGREMPERVIVVGILGGRGRGILLAWVFLLLVCLGCEDLGGFLRVMLGRFVGFVYSICR